MTAVEHDPLMAWFLGVAAPEPDTRAGDSPPVHVEPGSREERYATQALANACDRIREAPRGRWNVELNNSALGIFRLAAGGFIDKHEAWQALTDADTRDPSLPGHREGVRATQATLESAWEAAQRDPIIELRDEASWMYAEGPSASGTGTSGSASPPGGESASGAPLTAEERHAREVAREAARLRIQREARRAVDSEDAVAGFREPPWRPTLAAELLIPDEPIAHRLARLLPVGGNATLAAQFKTGKTTLVNALARSLADGIPFLGKYEVAPPAGRVAIFNYEVDERQYRAWLRDAGIANADGVAVLNLREYRMPLTSSFVEDWIVRWLVEREASVWVVDPFARAFGGAVSENDNAEVGRFLETLDVIKGRAGIEELIMPVHTGRGAFEVGEERARGATRLDDWADVRWLLTKDEMGNRYFRATGRDVEEEEMLLRFDAATRGLSAVGGNRRFEETVMVENAVMACIKTTDGISHSELRAQVRKLLSRVDNTKVDDAIARLEARGAIRVEPGGTGKATRHWLMSMGLEGEE